MNEPILWYENEAYKASLVLNYEIDRPTLP